MKIYIVAILLFSVIAYSGPPDWTLNPSRLIEGGDLLHWGSGESEKEEIALFKAENMAQRSLVLECGFPHRDMKIWERHTEKIGNKFKAYARAGIYIGECERIKKIKFEEKEKLNNKRLAENLELYDQYLKAELAPHIQDKVIAEIKNKIVNLIKTDLEHTKKQMQDLENRINSIEAKPTGTTQLHIHQKTIMGTEAKYQECIEDYNDLMAEANTEAYQSSVPLGNLANGKAGQIYNKAQKKLSRCLAMKKSKGN